MSWRDVVEYIMLGATTVQTCTAVMWGGYRALGELLSGLEKYLEENGLASLDAIRGITLPHITTTEAYAQSPPKYAVADPDKCNGCRACEKHCFYDAIRYEDGLARVEPARCDGCGLCVLWCPVGAIALE